MASPLTYTNVFGDRRTEPSVTVYTEVQTVEPIRQDRVNDLIILSDFPGGKPLDNKLWANLSSLAGYHDPLKSGARGVALARVAKSAFADEGVFGAAAIRTVRVNSATQSTRMLKAGSTDLLELRTSDYGNHTRRARSRLSAGTRALTKKLVFADDNPARTFTGDNLGELLQLQYVGAGSAAVMSLLRESAVVSYSGQPSDGDNLTVNGVVFEFDDNDAVTSGRIAVEIGASADATFASLATAIAANAPGTSASHSAAGNTITLVNHQDGVVVAIGSGTFTSAAAGAPASLRTTVTAAGSDEAGNLTIPLQSPQFSTLQQLAAFIASQAGYTARVSPYANKFIASVGLDVPGAPVDIRTAERTLYGYVAAIADWVNNNTRGMYAATIVTGGEPDEDTADVAFTGGNSPVATAADFEAALELVGATMERGGIVLVDCSDSIAPVVLSAAVTFCQEQASGGKWFRLYGALPQQSGSASERVSKWSQQAAALDSSFSRWAVQRMAVIGQNNTVEYIDPIFVAAALAGGAAGNQPFVNPLTNKRLRFAGIHPEDNFDEPTRVSLIEAGITVAKNENGLIKIALAVTGSLDPDRRMPRVASEIDTLRQIDSDIRFNLLQFRGKWANSSIVPSALGVMGRILRTYTEQGALVAGVDEFGEPRPAWNFGEPAAELQAGVLKLKWTEYIGGEVNHIEALGAAEYQRLVATLSGAPIERSFSVPIR